MSWQAYVDNLVATGSGISKACLIGLNGAIWTPPANNTINITQEEALKIGAVFTKGRESGNAGVVQDTFSGTGITLEGVKYMFLRDIGMEGKMVTAKKSGLGNIVLERSTTAIVIGFIPEDLNHKSGSANTAVNNMTRHLEGSGY